jgi:hypothetical protein
MYVTQIQFCSKITAETDALIRPQVKVPASPRVPLQSVDLNVNGSEGEEKMGLSPPPPKKALLFDRNPAMENGVQAPTTF